VEILVQQCWKRMEWI